MKTHIYSLLVRWYIATGKELPAWLRKACQQDAKLANLLKQEEELSQELRQVEEPTLDAVSAEALSRRIMNALSDESRIDDQFSEPKRSFNWTPVALAAAACLVAIVALRVISPENPEEIIAADDASEQPRLVIGQIPIDASNWENPLDREVENVLSDARGVVNFLAGNFLPSDLSNELVGKNKNG